MYEKFFPTASINQKLTQCYIYNLRTKQNVRNVLQFGRTYFIDRIIIFCEHIIITELFL